MTERCTRFAAVLFTLLGLCTALSIGCNRQAKKTTGSEKIESTPVVAVSYALQYLTQRIAGDTVEVGFHPGLTRNGKPSVGEIQAVQSADLVVINGGGAPYAKWLERVSLVDSKLCKSTYGFAGDDFIQIPDHKIVHNHGPKGEHSHAFSVPYCWLSPWLAKKQAATIAESLTAIYPEHAKTFAANLEELNTDLDQLITEFTAARFNRDEPVFITGKIDDAAVVPDDSVFSTSPLTMCFTRSLGLKDHYLFLFEPGNREELAKSQAKLTALHDPDKPQCILVTPTAERDFAKFLSELPEGIKTISIDLLDETPKEGDYLSVMRQNLKAIKGVFEASIPIGS